jgi:hypothetical protein
MTAAAILNLVATLIQSLAPVVSGLVMGGKSEDEARAEALLHVDDFLASLVSLRSRVTADDEKAIQEAKSGGTP